jgi:FkbM family methyltransferase
MEFSTYTLANKVNNFTLDVISDDLYIRNTLAHGHEWDGWMRPDIEKLYKPGTDIVDIGGNIGWNSLMFSDYGPVHTFEPLFHSVISKNVAQNTLKNPVTVYPVGLSNVSETILIYKPIPQDYGLTNYGGCSMTPNDKQHLPTGYPVKIDRLDDVYSGVPSIIKIDVEGLEYQVVLGAENIIRKYKPALYIEIFDFDTSPIVPFIKNLGYDTIVKRPECNYLCVCLSS